MNPALAVIEKTEITTPVYDAMCKAIAAAYCVDEVKDMRDKAIALQHYSAQANNVEAERQACEIRLRAERRCGQLLREMEKAKGARGQLVGPGVIGGHTMLPPMDQPSTLADLGLSKKQSADFQRMAQVPEPVFEAAVKQAGASTASIVRLAPAPPERPKNKIDERALWLWGRLKDFERDGLLDLDPGELLTTMSPNMLEDVSRLAPQVAQWLIAARR